MTQELVKPSIDRAEWLMYVGTLLNENPLSMFESLLTATLYRWVDADSIIINPSIPPDLFLPPASLSHINFVVTRDQNGLNTGVFYLRVCSWSISFLVDTLATRYTGIYLGTSVDQEAMKHVLKRTSGGLKWQGYRDGVVYIPRIWINTYESDHGYEDLRGDMLVHFPGLGETRWTHMADWLDIIERTSDRREYPLEETAYMKATCHFWQEYSSTYDFMKETEQLQSTRQFGDRVGKAVQSLKASLKLEADDVEAVHRAKQNLYMQVNV